MLPSPVLHKAQRRLSCSGYGIDTSRAIHEIGPGHFHAISQRNFSYLSPSEAKGISSDGLPGAAYWREPIGKCDLSEKVQSGAVQGYGNLDCRRARSEHQGTHKAFDQRKPKQGTSTLNLSAV